MLLSNSASISFSKASILDSTAPDAWLERKKRGKATSGNWLLMYSIPGTCWGGIGSGEGECGGYVVAYTNDIIIWSSRQSPMSYWQIGHFFPTNDCAHSRQKWCPVQHVQQINHIGQRFGTRAAGEKYKNVRHTHRRKVSVPDFETAPMSRWQICCHLNR